ncbi:hypothetical protein D3C78_1539290 [compost metagenome]
MRRVVRTMSLTPRCSSSASSRRPMMAGATPSALAAAVRLPLVATDTNDSNALSLSMLRLWRQSPKPPPRPRPTKTLLLKSHEFCTFEAVYGGKQFQYSVCIACQRGSDATFSIPGFIP